MTATDSTYVWPLRVYWEDTDGGGVVYNANYLCFLERARTEWLRAKGISQSELKARAGVVLAVRRVCCDFLAPAHLDDYLWVSVRVVELRKASILLEQTIRRDDGTQVLEAQVKAACLQALSWRPCRFPKALTSALGLPQNSHISG